LPVSSPAVLGRLKGFCKPYDFVLAPILRDSKSTRRVKPRNQSSFTRFSKHSEECSSATYYNVRTGKECRVTTTGKKNPTIVPVKSYREILHQYLCNPESKFNGPDGKPCGPWTRGILERRHIIAGVSNYCGEEFKRKLEQGPVDHETDFKVKVYANGRVRAEPEILRDLSEFSERDTNRATGLSRRIIRHVRHGGQVKRSRMQRIADFLRRELNAGEQGRATERNKKMHYKNPEHKRQWEREHRTERNAKRRMRRLEDKNDLIGRNPAPDPILAQKPKSSWKEIISFAVGLGILLLAVCLRGPSGVTDLLYQSE
jgi:hypothetical protein